MANVVNSNTLYVDATGALTDTTTLVHYIAVTATGANAVVALQDAATNAAKLNLRVATSGVTEIFDFVHRPISFPTGVEVGTLTNAIVTLVVSKSGG